VAIILDCVLFLAFVKCVFVVIAIGLLPDCFVEWSAKSLKDQGAYAVKLFIYYVFDDYYEINIQLIEYIERIGSVCV
ncbi:tagatose-bisphosphate aldolase, partial [Staphylococcus aureus]|nr:tagatose-bisphosphate aldolase [Staphylococcus aureus]